MKKEMIRERKVKKVDADAPMLSDGRKNRPAVIPYLHKMSQGLKKVGFRYDAAHMCFLKEETLSRCPYL